MYGFDFRKFPGAKTSSMDFEETEKLKTHLQYVDFMSKAFLYGTIFTGGMIFFLMKDSGDIFPGFPLWMFVIILMVMTQIPVGIFIKKNITQPFLDDLLLGEKIEISTKIVRIIKNSKGEYIQIGSDEVPGYLASLPSLENFTPGENVLIGITPKTMKIVSIKKVSL